MRILPLLTVLLPLLAACGPNAPDSDVDRKTRAVEFLRGVYTGDATVVDELAAPDIVVSYPIFSEIFDTPSIRGRDAVSDFATGFGSRWIDATVTVRSAVAEGDTVVLVWEFQARRAAAPEPNAGEPDEQAWGGITLYRFNASDEIILELGEESAPGPVARVPEAFDDG